MTDFINKIIQQAMHIVKDIPPPYHDITYEAVLKYLLATKGMNQTENHHPKIESISAEINPKDRVDLILQSNYDWPSTNIPKLVALGEYLLLLKIAKDDFNVDDLSSSEIRIILHEKFRISKTINAVSMSLMEALGKYVDRIRRGNEYFYKITPQGRYHLENLQKKLRSV
ncbi:MAG: hypothetical protein KGL95_14730 [Patescibacteria group bacterium]|nr:hypothetical protein [Patescibacteria group bacterium]